MRGRCAAKNFVKIVVIVFLVAIVASLGSALYYLVTDRGGSKRVVKALALRVGLSLTLFILLMAAYYFGLIQGKIT
jgi:cation transporter-like permease